MKGKNNNVKQTMSHFLAFVLGVMFATGLYFIPEWGTEPAWTVEVRELKTGTITEIRIFDGNYTMGNYTSKILCDGEILVNLVIDNETIKAIPYAERKNYSIGDTMYLSECGDWRLLVETTDINTIASSNGD